MQATAGRKVFKAIKKGLLEPASDHACEDCGIQATQYDHRDYRKPLMVAPVCHGCNLRRPTAMPLPDPIDRTAGGPAIMIDDFVAMFGTKKAACKVLGISRQALWLWERECNGQIPGKWSYAALKLLIEAERGSEG